MAGPARTALDTMVSASPVLQHPQAAALVQLAGVLADQMDAAGSEPSTRLTAAYLSALVNLRRLSPVELDHTIPTASRLAVIRAMASTPQKGA